MLHKCITISQYLDTVHIHTLLLRNIRVRDYIKNIIQLQS